jgi:hypothetical protein
MYYIVESNKTFEQASADFEDAVKRNELGVLQSMTWALVG